jgi:hypothetical protein
LNTKLVAGAVGDDFLILDLILQLSTRNTYEYEFAERASVLVLCSLEKLEENLNN